MLGCKVDKMGEGNGKKFRAPSAPLYVWPVAVDPWQLSWPGGQGGGGGGSRTGTEETSPPCPSLKSLHLTPQSSTIDQLLNSMRTIPVGKPKDAHV